MEIKEGFIIANEYQKQNLLKDTKDFKNYIFISYEELIHKIYGEASKKSVFYLMKEYEFSYDVAKEYMKYIPFVEKKNYNDFKLDSLVSAKSFLEKQNLILKDDFFLYRLPQFPITFFDLRKTKQDQELKRLLSTYTEVIEIEDEKESYIPKVYEYESIDDEVYDLCNTILKLKDNGSPFSKMHVLNVTAEYEFLLKRLANTYSIPFAFPKEKNISHTKFAIKFLQLLKEKKTFTEIIEELPDSEFMDSILGLISDYDLKDEAPYLYEEFFQREFKKIGYPKKIYKDMVDLSDEYHFDSSDYVFYLGLNQGSAPRIYKDEGYLKDEEFDLLSLPTSIEKNKEERRKLIYLLTKTKNIYPSYSKKIGTTEKEPSNILSELKLEVISKTPEYGYSKKEDSLRLARAISIYDKIREKDECLKKYSISQIPYKTFDNRFKGIDKKNMSIRFTNDKPNSLAYSSMKTYFECPFHFYLDRILKLNEFDSTTATRLGTYSHAVMQDSYKKDFSFEDSILKNKMEGLKDLSEEDFRKDEFYFNQMKSVLSSLLEFNHKHEELSSLKNVLCEEHILIKEDNLQFEGYIDKMMYTEIDGEIYVCIIDYKTGRDYISLNNVWDGFHLQLPSYMYLLSKYERFKNKKLHILGIYLQKVNMIALDNTIDLVAQREKAFRLQGYTISDMSLIPLLDPSYTSSDYIMSMNVTKAGQFGPYAKIVTEEEEEELIQLIDTFIHQTHQGVMNGEFPIAPKRIGKDDQSCTYCKYKDICFKTYKDYVYLEKKEFPKKEEN